MFFYLYAHADSTYFTSLPLCVCECVCGCVFPSTVKASPDWSKKINVMPEIRLAMLC